MVRDPAALEVPPGPGTAERATGTRGPLSRDDWIGAAIHAFRNGGRDAVRVEVLAEELGVTKGSFYWHFRNRAELLEGILAAWEQETERGIEAASEEETPLERLRAFFRRVSETEQDYPPDVEILAWAREEPRVADVAKRVEGRRLAFVHENLLAAGLEPKEAGRRAEIAYLASQGWVFQAGYGARASETRTPFTADVFDLLLDL